LGRTGIYTAATWEALAESFVERFAAGVRPGDQSVWVLVPTNLAARHLSRRAARQAGPLVGPRFMTLKDAARRIARAHLARGGLGPVPGGAQELALHSALSALPADSPFHAFGEFRNAAPAMLEALNLLADCSWRPESLRRAAGTAGERAAARRFRAMADLWAELEEWKSDRGYYTVTDLISMAASPDLEPAEKPRRLAIYGFYDFTPTQQRLIGRLIDLAEDSLAFVLWRKDQTGDAPGYEYARPAVEWLTGKLGPVSEIASKEDEGSDLARLNSLLFAEREAGPAAERPDEAGYDADGTVRVLNCPGRPPQAAEVVREVLRQTRDGEQAPAIGVLVRSGDAVGGPLVEAFDRAGIPVYLRQGLPLADTAAGRVALALLELADGEAERAAVVEFLSVARVEWPQDLSATALDRVSREAGVLRGREQWRERLRGRAEHLLRQAEREEREEAARALRRDAQLCTAAAGFLEEFFQETDAFAGAMSANWSLTAERARDLLSRYVPLDATGRREVLDCIEDLGKLEETGVEPEPGAVRWLLGRRLSSESCARGSFQGTAVTLSTVMAARGVDFDYVILPDLVEKAFPLHVGSSSLLTEPEREVLNSVAGQVGAEALPRQKDRPAEERYLFRLSLAAARDGVTLAFPRLERTSGRPRLPSRFLTEACSALTGLPVTAETLNEGRPSGLVERVPMDGRRRVLGDLSLAIDECEHDGAVFAGQEDGRLRTGYLSAVSETFERALRMERLRWGKREFGPYDGKIRDEDLVDAINAAGPWRRPVSPTRLETYAGCPFHYFMTHVLDVTELEAPTEEFELPPPERGRLIHRALNRLFDERLRGCSFGDLTDKDQEEILLRAGEILDEIGEVHRRNHPATWEAEREKCLHDLDDLLNFEREEHATATPRELEFTFGDEAEFGMEVEDTRLNFHGRIDRIDRIADGALQVVDYKTGSSSGYRKNSLLGGQQLQMPLYLLAAADALEAEAGRAVYLSVKDSKEVPEFELETLRERMDDLRRALALIVGGIAAGTFLPYPSDLGSQRGRCEKYCPYTIVCGSARSKLAEMKESDPDLRPLAQLREIE
jgi:RecB family exonuclease